MTRTTQTTAEQEENNKTADQVTENLNLVIQTVTSHGFRIDDEDTVIEGTYYPKVAADETGSDGFIVVMEGSPAAGDYIEYQVRTEKGDIIRTEDFEEMYTVMMREAVFSEN